MNSGEPLRDIPGASGIGSLTAGAVELSNTDIGQNLIELILASTQYRGGTRVITTAQQLLDELLNRCGGKSLATNRLRSRSQTRIVDSATACAALAVSYVCKRP